jgi:hypothetical protein
MIEEMTLAAYRASQRAPRRSEETDAQIALFDLLTRLEGRWPLLQWAFHVPNGEKRDKATAARLKAMGLKPGVCDILVPVQRYDAALNVCWPGLAVEMKATTGKPSDDQKRWLAHFKQQGWFCAVNVGDWRPAATLIISWCGGDPSVVEGL